MSFKSLALVLIVAGGLVLAYGRYGYQQDPAVARADGVELVVGDPRAMNMPTWAGIATIGVGLSLFLVLRSR